MIRFGKTKDCTLLKDLCIHSQSAKQEKLLEYYFAHEYEHAKVLISELDGLLVSQVHRNTHIVNVQNNQVRVSYLSGMSTHYDYRKRGIMRDLLDLMIEDDSHNFLFTFADGYHPKLFDKYGFEKLTTRKRYVIQATDIPVVNALGVSNHYDVKELTNMYKQFTRVFHTYFMRDETYYEAAIKRWYHCGKSICAYYDEDEQIKGYCVYEEKENNVEVSEIIYADSLTLVKMLKYLVGHHSYISVEVSEAERLEKIFKQSIPRVCGHTLVRLNQVKLFNKLFNTSIKNTKDCIAQLKLPIYFNEKI